MRVAVIGAGVAGLVTALELAERGVVVELFERSAALGEQACSWAAGGMLAPWCERESAEEAVVTLGRQALDWWPRHYPGTVTHGTLVLAPARDAGELTRFAARTSGYERLDGDGVAALEPDLAGRFRQGLFFAQEAHLDPRLAMASLAEALQAAGVPIHYGVAVDETALDADRIVDCRGLSARDRIDGLRGVRGEMLVLRTDEIRLSRPVRLLHPRIPLYVVPRADGHFMIGATMIESDDRRRVSARSAIELLSAAYALHPAFGEAEIVELRADVRPAFPDNLPRIVEDGRVLRFNGLFRHGFLLSPALAGQVADRLLASRELSDAHHCQRRHA
ncbi:putative thiamine biosynthesis oxidoreductase ThiO [Bosea sp. 62]|uniref:glycine oxidase ThiO n=1 Tax=unclassified Bosea (in: a-proteobacteria) TaxID=2653178 RepID=UPI00125895A9|nr:MULTISPECIES: glycine oxidase ThiO [unclassified Bosea (in: a-proteobacteria)]CAD5287333.1 putative thiamine biosynthesis oxidoreductase ThiO [Bosea sp. 21B]CAD5289668.1 putative thiamine biosynthesis oxidoreductase ThiO [Bosea sp. 46]CAD5301094.1 putative thiamine biosynthesis oxidoreductase ThiO [Bosea sp. 7B]VVT60476.1 putative thiamine biosynthesis oxidoreductase ThiO [Bosea sp. EC-HK365B]VXB01733.1 putative thiamine biosynthesis oxidoreductase ThiO [Bosea sp. 62]